MTSIRYRTVQIDGLEIFFREAGDLKKPAVLLLHGFPSSSFMFRDLIPLLAKHHYVVAPDYPGFGFSSFPEQKGFDYTFHNLANIIDGLLTELSIDQFAMYIQDYGAPIGLRLALMRPSKVRALIVQNGNAYEEGLSEEWLPLKRFWSDPTPKTKEELRNWLTADGVRSQYVAGMPEESIANFSPDTWTLDWSRLSRPGNIDVQLDLFYDYRTNIDLYPAFHRFFRNHQPSTLILWGQRDPFFTLDGGRAYLLDIPEAAFHHFEEGGHFLLETHLEECSDLIIDHLGKVFAATNSRTTTT